MSDLLQIFARNAQLRPMKTKDPTLPIAAQQSMLSYHQQSSLSIPFPSHKMLSRVLHVFDRPQRPPDHLRIVPSEGDIQIELVPSELQGFLATSHRIHVVYRPKRVTSYLSSEPIDLFLTHFCRLGVNDTFLVQESGE